MNDFDNEKRGKSGERAEKEYAGEAPRREEPLIDIEAILQRVDNDRELLADLFAIFIEDYPNQIEKIKTGIRENNSALVERGAHTLKGAVSNFDVKRCMDIAFDIEQMGRRNDLSHAEESLGDLIAELERFKAFVEQLQFQV